MGSSSPNPSPTANLMASDSKSDAESGFLSPNPLLTPMVDDSRLGGERGSSSPNPSLTPTGYASSDYKARAETTHSPPYLPPTGTGYAPPPLYHRSFQPTPLMKYGGPYPGQPSYYPPPPTYNHTDYDAPSEKKRKNWCLHRLIMIIFVFVISMLILGFFLNLILRPKCPSVFLTSVILSSFNMSSSTISSYFSVKFSIHNPGQHMDIYYPHIRTDVTYGFDTISSSPQPGFVQNSMSETSKVFTITEVDKAVSAFTMMRINNDLANDGVVRFEVKLDARMRFSQTKWLTENMVVYCPDVKIRFVNGTAKGGTMVGPPISCDVYY